MIKPQYIVSMYYNFCFSLIVQSVMRIWSYLLMLKCAKITTNIIIIVIIIK